jgi:Domain of unknown function (DUF1937)
MSQHYGKLVYFASPFTHADKAVRDERLPAIARACGWFMNNRRDIFFFSPICSAHPIAIECSLPYEWQFWAEIDECMVSRCEEIWVLAIPGFKKSTGVTAERKIAERLGLPCRFVIPQQDGSYVVTDEEPADVFALSTTV